MRIIDETPIKFQVKGFKLMTYCFWLIKEILKSNITVTKTILSPKIKVKQNMFDVPLSPKSEAAQVIFANSITLTPGTITVETEKNSLLVHALNFSDNTEDEIADMGNRVSEFERKGA
jgi:multicomponent Na+:H+ antiporter subunit E|tara:strand:+ start:273 stop:626 length:354 start_codon:yes stop_codon:yes gene_type:complete